MPKPKRLSRHTVVNEEADALTLVGALESIRKHGAQLGVVTIRDRESVAIAVIATDGSAQRLIEFLASTGTPVDPELLKALGS